MRLRAISMAGVGVLAAAYLVGVAGPAYAAAATVTRSGSTLVFTAGTGVANRVTVSQSSGTITFRDSGGPVGPGAGSGCVANGANEVVCVASGVARVSVSTLDLNDSVTLASSLAVPGTVSGGNGSDSINGGPRNDTLNGDGGTDSLRGGGGDDTLNGGPGNDTFSKSANIVIDSGRDAFFGGTGTGDKITFSGLAGAPEEVHVSLDDAANDGFLGGTDNVHSDIEHVTSFNADDTLIGSGADNVLDGRAGNDRIVGGGGNDTLIGWVGNDSLFGDGGFDQIDGGDGTDHCEVGAGGGTEVNCETGNLS